MFIQLWSDWETSHNYPSLLAQIVEEEEGGAAVWFTYIVCSVGELGVAMALFFLSMAHVGC